MKKIICFVSILLSCFVLFSQEINIDKFSSLIKKENLKKHVLVLASDSCAGRGIGSEGIKKAKNYIQQFWVKDTTLKDLLNSNYLQKLELFQLASRNHYFYINNEKLEEYKDFKYNGSSKLFNKKLPIIFGGYGSKQELKKLNLKGKAVLILCNNLRTSFFNAKRAYKKGAELCIFANPKNKKQFETIARQYKSYFGNHKPLYTKSRLEKYKNNISYKYRYIEISETTLKKLTGKHSKYWLKQYKKKKLNNKIIGHIQSDIRENTYKTVNEYNVLSYIPGKDTNKIIVVGAHYDHLGKKKDKIYYGADDNATGTSSIIELSKAFSNAVKNKYQPESTIIFVAFTAEESGLIGSQFFANNFDQIKNVKITTRKTSRNIKKNNYLQLNYNNYEKNM